MKKVFMFLLALCLALSCAQELSDGIMEDVTAGKKVKMTFSASINEDTKAELMNGNEVWWHPGDKILINGDPFYANDFGNRVEFVGETVPAAEYCAIFPGNTSSEWENGTYTFSLPTCVYVYPGHISFQSAAKCKKGENTLQFTHLLGYVKLTIPEELGHLRYVEVYANGGENIAGTRVKVDYSGSRPSLKEYEDRNCNVNTLGFDGPGDYYIPLYPGTYSKGLTFAFYQSDGLAANKSINQEITLEPGVVQNIGEIKDLPEFGPPSVGIRGSLMRLYEATGGDNWNNNDGWGTAEPIGNWYGIFAITDDIGITEMNINLSFNNLKGSITSDVLGELQELTRLDVSNNTLLSVDFSKNTNLKVLSCGNNPFTDLDLTGLACLETLWCSEGPLESLKLDGCVALKELYCMDTYLTSLDLSTNVNLEFLYANDTKLESLDLRKCTSLKNIYCFNNHPEYGLKNLNLSGLQNLKIVDCGGNFLESLDVTTNLNLEYLNINIDFLTSLDISKNTNLKVFSGARKFAEPDDLPEGTPRLTEIDISNNVALEEFGIASKGIRSLDLSNNVNLRSLSVTACRLDALDISFNKALEYLTCNNSGLTSLDVSGNPDLKVLSCKRNKIPELDLTNNTRLTRLMCDENDLTELDVTFCPDLEYLECWGNPDLSEVYTLSSQNYECVKDNWTTLIYKDGSVPDQPDQPDQPSYYESSDYSQDGLVHTLQSASKGNGIDIVLMGDGYSDRLIADGTYARDMNAAMDNFFTEEPYKSFRDHFNVYYVTAVSKNDVFEKGASTAFESHFGDGTLVEGNIDTVLEYTNMAIDDERMDEATVIVLVNSVRYAGTCYMYMYDSMFGDYGHGLTISFCPMAEDETTFAQIIQHEAAGHGFAKLGDEYSNMFSRTIPDYEVETLNTMEAYGWYRNIDVTDDPGAVKWSHFLNDSRYECEGLGVYEGSFTYEFGVYRPSWQSIMRHNIGGFNAPSREAIYYRIHKLAYGSQWDYYYEEFAEYDARNRKTTTKAGGAVLRPDYVDKDFVPLAPPVVIRDNWRDSAGQR